MDQNQTVDNDLQKAIDDITNTTNVDPVFSDPVAAPSSIPERDTGGIDEPVNPFPEPKLEPAPTPAPAPEPTPSLGTPDLPELDMANFPPQPNLMPPAESPSAPPEPKIQTTPNSTINHNPDMRQIKEAALRDLVPLLDHLNIDPSQKFNIYRDIFENLKDYTALESAYHAATEITDDTKRAEALLYLVESIDKI